jgi:hypothetical protein
MTWKVTIHEKSMLLDDLSENDFVAATQDHPEVSWLRLYTSPAAHPAALYDLLCSCALRMEVPQPERPKNIKESVGLLKHLELVDDDLPTAFDEGGIPLGGTEDETETTSSSTSTEPEAGPPSKPERRH